jgi:hypothetical protein
MSRGNAEFPVMKGFGSDFVGKGDVAEEEKLDEKLKEKHPPKAPAKVKEDDLTIDPELALVEEAAGRDIEDGYVSDIQGAQVGKGFAAYNEMCTKGMAADLSVDPYNAGDIINKISAGNDVVFKELGDGMVSKGAMFDTLGRSVGGVKARVGQAYRAGKQGIKDTLSKVGGVVPGRAQASEALQSGTTQDPGKTVNRIRRGAADVLSDKRKVGAGVVGTGLVAAGGTAAALSRNKEEKCAPGVKTKGVLANAGKKIKKVVTSDAVKMGAAGGAGLAAGGAAGMALAHGERDQGYKHGEKIENKGAFGVETEGKKD